MPSSLSFASGSGAPAGCSAAATARFSASNRSNVVEKVQIAAPATTRTTQNNTETSVDFMRAPLFIRGASPLELPYTSLARAGALAPFPPPLKLRRDLAEALRAKAGGWLVLLRSLAVADAF